MNNTSRCFVVGVLALAGSPGVQAQSPHTFSANVALVSDYLFRGISQSNRDPAVQGGFDYTYDSDWIADPYLGVWASSIEFAAGASNPASIEIDYYGGITGEFSNGLIWDVGGIYYHYPSQNEDVGGDYDYVEGYGGLTYTFAGSLEPTFSTYVYYSPDFFGETGSAIYVTPSIGLSLPHGFGFSLGYGYQDVDDIGEYQHWNIGLSKSFGPVSLGLTYSDTFDNDDFCTGIDLCDDTLVFSVAAGF